MSSMKNRERTDVEMNFLELVNGIISVCLAILLFGNAVYPALAWIFRKKYFSCGAPEKRRYAVMICARNEENVIADIIGSVRSQDYPAELVDIFVLADNCDDETAEIAKRHGAETFVRNDKTKVGKGYALNYLYAKIILTNGDIYDGFFVFDADNLLVPDYISKMNRAFKGGNSVLTGVRNTKNYGDSFVSAGYSIGWLFQTGLLNSGREILGVPCFVNGTGFLMGAEVLRKSCGWNWFTLTEDCEFTAYCALNGIDIGICREAEFYDEQPVSFGVAWTQRLRWMKGKYQAVQKFGKDVFKGIFSKRFLVCLDSFSNIFPTSLLVLCSGVLTLTELILSSQNLEIFVFSLLILLLKWYISVSFLGFLTLILWWDRIKATASRKIFLALYYPVHIAMYIPITLVAAFKSVEWVPIKHGVSKSV